MFHKETLPTFIYAFWHVPLHTFTHAYWHTHPPLVPLCPTGDRMFREEYVRAQLSTVREYLSILNAHQLPRPLFQVTRYCGMPSLPFWIFSSHRYFPTNIPTYHKYIRTHTHTYIHQHNFLTTNLYFVHLFDHGSPLERSHLFKMLHRFMDGKANGALRVQLAEGGTPWHIL